MQRTFDLSPLGYGAFALVLWLTSMAPAGWFSPADGTRLMLLSMAILGGCALGVAGVLQWSHGHVLDASLFLLFAGYWSIAALLHSGPPSLDAASPGLLGWYDLMWTLLAFGVWLAAYHGNAARMLFTFGLWLSLLSYALAHWLGLGALTVLGGYLGLITAVVGLYTAIAELLNATHGHTVLPLGDASPPESRKPSASA